MTQHQSPLRVDNDIPGTPDNTSLKHRIVNAGLWSLGGYGFSMAMRFGSNLIMTRLLVPEMFGIMAITNTIMIGLTMFSDIGLRQNVVQSARGNDPAFLNSAWVLQICRGVALWLVGLAIALATWLAQLSNLVPPGSTYADHGLPIIIAAVSVVSLIAGFDSTKLYEANRSLSLKAISKIEIVSQLSALLLMLVWALNERSIWALVVGNVSGILFRTALSHLWLYGTPNRWKLEPRAAREIFQFGRWLFISSILAFAVSSGDRIILGGLIDSSTFGKYVIATLIYGSIEQVLSKIISEVSFPAISEVARTRPKDLSRSYYRIFAFIASFAYFSCGMLISLAKPLIGMLYDSRYLAAGGMLQILCIGLLTIPFRLATDCFIALGKPHLLSYTIAVRLASLLTLLPAGFYFFGLSGALWGTVLSNFSFLPLVLIYSSRLNVLNVRKEAVLLPVIFLGFAVGELFRLFIQR